MGAFARILNRDIHYEEITDEQWRSEVLARGWNAHAVEHLSQLWRTLRSQPRVFEPTFSTTSSGAGLGLAISRRLVESWGGVITLESDPGKGTRVTLTLQTAS